MIEHSVDEESVIKKARMVGNVEEAPLMSQNEPLVVADVAVKEVCIADESENGQVTVAEEEKKKLEEVSAALSLADTEHKDLKETMELEEVDVVVSGDANTDKLPDLDLEKNNETSVTSRDEFKEAVVLNPSVSRRKKLLVLDLNGLLADIVNPLADCKADINIGRRASEFPNIFSLLYITNTT